MSSTDKETKKEPLDKAPQPDSRKPPFKRTPPKQVADLISGVLSDVIARRSGMTLDLLAGWQDIVGPDYADCTLPEKIIWPKRASDTEPFQPGSLIVACDGAKALFFQHETSQILERVNFFFGFQAIEKIKLVQKPVGKPKTRLKPAIVLNSAEEQRLDAVLQKIDDPKLRKKLEAFGRGVISRQKIQKGP